MARTFLDIRANEADRPQPNAHTENPPVRLGSIPLLPEGEHNSDPQESDRAIKPYLPATHLLDKGRVLPVLPTAVESLAYYRDDRPFFCREGVLNPVVTAS